MSSRSPPLCAAENGNTRSIPSPPPTAQISPLVPPYTYPGSQVPALTSGPINRSHNEARIKLPIPAHTKSHHVPGTDPQIPCPIVARSQALDEFFGQTNCSQHETSDRGESTRDIFANFSEPETVSKYLFWYGFGAHIFTPIDSCNRTHLSFRHVVFPPFWAIGAIVLFLRVPEDVRPTSTDNDMTAGATGNQARASNVNSRYATLLRATERRWGRRCMYAWVTLLLVIVGVIVGLWAGRVGVFDRA
jgi:hypothetical protein